MNTVKTLLISAVFCFCACNCTEKGHGEPSEDISAGCIQK